jgi:hypothetical protein
MDIVKRVYSTSIVQFSKNKTYPYNTLILKSSCSVKKMLQRHCGLYTGYRQLNTIQLNEKPMCTTLQERRMRPPNLAIDAKVKRHACSRGVKCGVLILTEQKRPGYDP